MSEKAKWRGSPEQIDPIREFLRENCPQSDQGLVLEDLDLVQRCYGPNYDTDAIGWFRLIEFKFGFKTPENPIKDTKIGTLQRKYLQDEILRRGDPDGERYRGFYVVRYNRGREDGPWQHDDIVKVNRTKMSVADFLEWLQDRGPKVATLWKK